MFTQLNIRATTQMIHMDRNDKKKKSKNSFIHCHSANGFTMETTEWKQIQFYDGIKIVEENIIVSKWCNL